ncbi:gas vesicle protein GvpJ [Streptomyces fragilis]|uniref:gas vesicle protein GvpJ n=1 Tax=Streptomyces fragilis TaxID=67301 RepID=UPI000D5A0ABA
MTDWVDPTATTVHVPGPNNSTLADLLERILDKGVVIAGDIKVDLLDIELLTIRLRLFIASVDTAKRAGIDWWETDPAMSSRAARDALAEENETLRERLAALERRLDGEGGHDTGTPTRSDTGTPAHTQTQTQTQTNPYTESPTR